MWGVPMLILLIGSHVFFTIRTGFIQRKLPLAIKLTFTRDKESEGDISQFGALATSLSATVGTGNIVGVATAILAGGPGAVLWMWLTGILAIATKYAETFVAVKYRVKDDKGDMLGGAMYAWKRAFKKNGKTPWWALLGAGVFAILGTTATLGIGSAVQANAVTSVITSNFPGVDPLIIGIVIVIMVAVVILGGIKVITRVCEFLTPFMIIAYCLGCIVILCINWAYIWPAICLIVECAFTPTAAFGGMVGSGVMMALRFGVARGLFANESGMGSAPILAAAAKTKNPARQALVSMTSTFWDTVVICLLTGLVLISTMIANPGIAESGMIEKGAELTSLAFATIPIFGTPLLIMGMLLFSYSTMLGWSYYGNRCITYLFGTKAIKPYQIVFIIALFLGAVGIGDTVWIFADITNALMVVPNLIVVLLLSSVIAKGTRHYVWDGNIDEQDTTPIPVEKKKAGKGGEQEDV